MYYYSSVQIHLFQKHLLSFPRHLSNCLLIIIIVVIPTGRLKWSTARTLLTLNYKKICVLKVSKCVFFSNTRFNENKEESLWFVLGNVSKTLWRSTWNYKKKKKIVNIKNVLINQRVFYNIISRSEGFLRRIRAKEKKISFDFYIKKEEEKKTDSRVTIGQSHRLTPIYYYSLNSVRGNDCR